MPSKINFVLANSADPDEMLHNAAFVFQRTCLGISGLQRVNVKSGRKNKVLLIIVILIININHFCTVKYSNL